MNFHSRTNTTRFKLGTEKCKKFTYDRSDFYTPSGQVPTGFDGQEWESLDMKNHLFCDDGPQISALIISMSRIGATIGTLLSGWLPFK